MKRLLFLPLKLEKSFKHNTSSISHTSNFLRNSNKGLKIVGCSSSKAEMFHSSSNTMQKNEEYVEKVVCKDSDIKENEMKTYDLGDVGKVLLVRQKGQLSALGPKCTHYGAPLVSAALGDGRIRCQWHGACFNILTGDIEEFPGLDSLPCHQVTVENGDVKIRAKLTEVETGKRTKSMTKRNTKETKHIVLIGGGPSSAVCAETLRQEGFSGQLTLVCKENYLPYDRVLVDKAMNSPLTNLLLRNDKFYKDNGITVLKNTAAVSVNAAKKNVILSNGQSLTYDKLYVATGLKANKVNILGNDLGNVFTIRNYDDAQAVNALLKPETKVVVLGASFVALESAAFCLANGTKDVKIIMRGTVPFKQFLGERIGAAFKKLFEKNGATFYPNSGLKRCIDDGNGKVGKVELLNDTILNADIVIMGVGSSCLTDFLKNSGIKMRVDGTIEVDEHLRSSDPDVYVGGDISYAPVWSHNNEKAAIGHYGLAQYHGRIAALNILGKNKQLRAVPYFFTKVFDTGLRFAGHGTFDDIVYVGNVEKLKYVAFYLNGDEVIAASSVSMDPVVSQFAEVLAQGKKLYRRDVENNNNFDWTSTLHN